MPAASPRPSWLLRLLTAGVFLACAELLLRAWDAALGLDGLAEGSVEARVVTFVTALLAAPWVLSAARDAADVPDAQRSFRDRRRRRPPSRGDVVAAGAIGGIRIAGVALAGFIGVLMVQWFPAGLTEGRSLIDVLWFAAEAAGFVLLLATVLLPFTLTVVAAGGLAGALTTLVARVRPAGRPATAP